MTFSNALPEQPTNKRPKRGVKRSTPGNVEDSEKWRSLMEGGVDEGTYYHMVQCPVRKCRSTDVPISRTVGMIRYHKCKACGKRFKSIQKPIIPPEQ